MATQKQKAIAAALAVLDDPNHAATDPTPMFGYRPEYHSQAEYDYQRLVDMASRWGQNAQVGQAVDAATKAGVGAKVRTAEDLSRAVTQWMDYAPGSSPGVITAFAQANLQPTDPGVTELLAQDAELQGLADAKAQNPSGSAGQAVQEASWFEDHTAWLRGVTRTAFDMLSAPLQAVQGGLSGAAGALGILGAEPNDPNGPDYLQAAAQLAGIAPFIAAPLELAGAYKTPNPWEQTVAGQQLLDFLGQPQTSQTWAQLTGQEPSTGTEVTPGVGTVTTGDGWLTADENSGVGLAQRQATYASARTKYNEAWTLGRGVASLAVDSPDSTLYKVSSGLIDAAVSIFADPTIVGSKFKLSRDAIQASRRLAEAGTEAAQRTAALANAEKLTTEQVAAHQARLSELETEMAGHQKFLDSLTPEQRAHADALRQDEDALRAARPVDQAERDSWVAAQRAAATTPESDRHYVLTGQRDELHDLLAAEQARAERNAARRQTRGHIRLNEADTAVVDTLHARYGPGGLENEYASLADDAGQFTEQYIGGVLTAEPLGALKRGAKEADVVPAYSAAGESVVSWRGSKAPVIKAADEPVDAVDGVAASLRRLLLKKEMPAAQGMTRRETVAGYESLLTDPSLEATWGHLFSYAVSTGTTKALAEALAANGIDGIDGVRAILQTGEGGRWWTNAADLAVHGLPTEVSSSMAREALPEVRANIAQIKAQIASIDGEMKGIAADAKDRVAAATAQYDTYQAAMRANRLDEATALREQLRTQAGVHVAPDMTSVVDDGKMYDFLFRGRAGQRAFEALAEMTSPSDIMRVTGWDAKTAERVAAATDRDGILTALAPEFGLSIDHGLGKITTGMRYKRGQLMERNRFYAAMERATGTFVPIGQRIDYANKDQMVKVLRNYADYFSMDKAVTRKYLDRIIAEPDEFNQRNHVTEMFDEMAGHLVDRMEKRHGMSKGALDHVRQAIHEGTRVYRNVEERGHEYWQERIALDDWIGYVLSDGEHVRLPNAHIDSEFAQGGTLLPDPREMMEAMGRVSGLIARNESLTNVYEFTSRIATDWWRTAMLLRGAYIIRNIAEEQIRTFLSGGRSVFNHPLQAAAMTMAMRDSNGPMTRLARRFATFDQGIDGTHFRIPKDAEQDLMDVHSDFLGTVLDRTSLLDNRTYRAMRNKGIVVVGKGEAGFARGWGDQLLALRASRIARLVVGDYPKSLAVAIKQARKQGPIDERGMVIDWLFNHPDGTALRDYMGKGSPQMRRIMDDEVGVRDYLYGEVGSVQARIDEMTAQSDQLREFLRTGILRDAKGEKVWETNGRRVGPLFYSDNHDYDALSKVLNDKYVKSIPPSHQIRVPTNLGTDGYRTRDNIVDKFFNISAKMERSAALGPEWKYAYWENVGKRAHMLDADGLAKARKYADEVLPRNSPVRKALADAKGDGPLRADDVHLVAGDKAGEHIRALYYDARQRNAAWHQVRLVFPFGQAWANTLKEWAQLSARNPFQVYKAGKAFQALQEEGSNTVYDAFNAVDPFGDVHYDDSQGFFYRDPNRGDQLTFRYPMMASPLAGLLMTTQDTQMALSAPVSSLNLAFSGDNPLPGLGPLAVGAVGTLGLGDKPGPVGDLIRAMAYPFGEPDPETGIIESFVPAWTKYAVFGSGLYNGGGEEFRRAQQKGALMATASRNDYGDLNDPMAQKRWFQDADTVARIASFIRGMGSFILPASPVTDWQTKDKSGNWLPVASVAKQYRDQENQYGNDQAIVNLVQQYGEKGLAALISATAGQKPLSDDAYRFMLNNPDASTLGEDTIAVMFPGDPSPITLAWQRAQGQRRDLSWNEKQDAAVGLLYRYQMAEVTRAAASAGWNADQIDEAKQTVLDRFGGQVPPKAFDPNYYDNILAGMRNAVSSPWAKDIPSTPTVAKALAAYDAALGAYRLHAKDDHATLTGKKAALWRDEFHQVLDELLASDPNAAGAIDALRSMTEER